MAGAGPPGAKVTAEQRAQGRSSEREPLSRSSERPQELPSIPRERGPAIARCPRRAAGAVPGLPRLRGGGGGRGGERSIASRSTGCLRRSGPAAHPAMAEPARGPGLGVTPRIWGVDPAKVRAVREGERLGVIPGQG